MIDVAMPWRAQPDRIAAFDYVTGLWADRGFRVVTADSDPKNPFNLSQARNRAVRLCASELVIVADADTVPDFDALTVAIGSCRSHGGVWWPFTEYRYLADTVTPGDDLATAPTAHVYPNSVGGLFVIRRAEYWRLGGFDERFTQWGWEDRAWELVVTDLSEFHRVPGTVFAFNHTAERNMRGPGRHLVSEYREAHRTKSMQALVDIRAVNGLS